MTTIKDILISLFGEYEPLLDSNEEIITTIAGLDYPYILSVILFIVCVYGVLRIIGGLVRD